MGNAILGGENLIDLDFYPVVITRGGWVSTLGRENLKNPLFVEKTRSLTSSPSDTQFEIDFSVTRDIKIASIPRHTIYVSGAVRYRYTDTQKFVDEDLLVNGAHIVGLSSVSLSAPSGSGGGGGGTALVETGDDALVETGTGDVLTEEAVDGVLIELNDWFTIEGDPTAYRCTATTFIPAGTSASVPIDPVLAAPKIGGEQITCRSGDYTTPVRDSGVKEVFADTIAWGSVPYGSPSFFTGDISEEKAARTKMPSIDVVPGESIAARYVLVEIFDEDNPDEHTDLMRFYISSGWQPSINIAYGLKKGRISNTTSLSTRGGAEFFDVRPNQRRVGFTINNLPFDEAMYYVDDIHEFVDVHKQIFFVLDPDDLSNLHRNSFLCRLQQIDDYDYPYYRSINAPFNLKEVIA